MTEQLQTGIPVLLYHRVVPDFYDPGIECFRLLQIAISQTAFEKQMRYLQAHHTVIRLADLVSAMTTGEPLPPNACVITFDDSYRDHYRYAFPILKRLGLAATFFVESGHTADQGRIRCLDRYYYLLDHSPVASFSMDFTDGTRMDSHPLNTFGKISLLQNSGLKAWLKQTDLFTQDRILTELGAALDVMLDASALANELYLSVQEMSEMVHSGMELGAHTISPSLLHVDIQTARAEIFESGDFVKNIAQTETIAFAYPFGEAVNSLSVSRLVRDYGYYAACTSIAGLNTVETNPFALKRLQLTAESL